LNSPNYHPTVHRDVLSTTTHMYMYMSISSSMLWSVQDWSGISHAAVL